MRSAPAVERAPRAAELPFPEVAAFARAGAVALLPVGSTEAHGPHLPLDTDVLIAEGVCDRLVPELAARGVRSLVFPPLTYGVTEFARPFAGTVSLGAEALKAYATGVVRGILEHGFDKVVLVNHHLEPAHFTALHEAVFALRSE
ncbi:MAG: creatininase family protein, partial [Myxococcales bacterium]